MKTKYQLHILQAGNSKDQCSALIVKYRFVTETSLSLYHTLVTAQNVMLLPRYGISWDCFSCRCTSLSTIINHYQPLPTIINIGAPVEHFHYEIPIFRLTVISFYTYINIKYLSLICPNSPNMGCFQISVK